MKQTKQSYKLFVTYYDFNDSIKTIDEFQASYDAGERIVDRLIDSGYKIVKYSNDKIFDYGNPEKRKARNYGI